MEEQAASKAISRTGATVHEIEHTDSELYKVGMYSTAAFAMAVGAWALICLSSAVIQTGGPVDLLKSMISAITGA